MLFSKLFSANIHFVCIIFEQIIFGLIMTPTYNFISHDHTRKFDCSIFKCCIAAHY